MEKKRTRFEDETIRRRKRKVLLGAVVLVVFLGLSYLFVWERVYTLRLAEENALTRQRVRDLKEKSKSLEYEINQLCSVKRIEDIARRDLALIPPREFQLVSFTVSSGRGNVAPADSVKPAPTKKVLELSKSHKETKPKMIETHDKASKPKADAKTYAKKPKARK